MSRIADEYFNNWEQAYIRFLTGSQSALQENNVLIWWHAAVQAGNKPSALWEWAGELMWRNDEAMIEDSGAFYDGKITTADAMTRAAAARTASEFPLHVSEKKKKSTKKAAKKKSTKKAAKKKSTKKAAKKKSTKKRNPAGSDALRRLMRGT